MFQLSQALFRAERQIASCRTPVHRLRSSRSAPSSSAGPSRLSPSLRCRHISSTSQTWSADAPSSPKRPSPYRLLQPHNFLSDFAPLHIAGWRLDNLAPQERLINPLSSVDESLSTQSGSEGGNGAHLQGRRLVRAYLMGEGKEGWRDTMRFAQRAGEVIEQQDHHPTLLISPSSDYLPTSPSLVQPETPGRGYIVEISTHTHTPLPPYPLPTKGGEKMKPGITTKDVRLAEKLEEAWREIMGGREKVEVKKE